MFLYILTRLHTYIHSQIYIPFVCSKDWHFLSCCCRAVWMSDCACILVFQILWINLKNATATTRKFTVTVMRNNNSNMQFSTHRRSLYWLLGLCLLLFETGKIIFDIILTKSNDLRHKLVTKEPYLVSLSQNTSTSYVRKTAESVYVIKVRP